TSPERVRGDAATAASDLWSLGATLYAAVEGRGPFDRVGGSTVITAGVATEDAPRAPSAGPLAPVIDALLSREPGSRPDATTAARLLSEAATAARTGARSLGDDWLAAEASSAARQAAADGAVGSADAASAGPASASAGAASASAASARLGAARSASGDAAVGAAAAGAAAVGAAAVGGAAAGYSGAGEAAVRNSVAGDAAAAP